MQRLNNYILEKLKIDKDSKVPYKYHPKDKWELREILKKCIAERGHDADLNDIDVSNITDMDDLFGEFEHIGSQFEPYNIDISKWNVSNVTTMEKMFQELPNFNCDLSKWDVSNVKDFHSTFLNCKKFKGEGLDKWNVENAETMQSMFCGCWELDIDLSDWDVSNLKEASGMFIDCKKMNFDLSKWHPDKLVKSGTWNMFTRSGFDKLPKWY